MRFRRTNFRMGSQGLAAGGYISGNESVGAHQRTVTHRDAAQELGSSADQNPVTQGRHLIDAADVFGAQGDLLMQVATASDLGPLTDDDALAVADHQTRSDFRCGCDLDSREPLTESAEARCQERDSKFFDGMGRAVERHRLEAAVEEQGVH